MRTILVLSANPDGTVPLELEREVLDIRKSLDRSKLQAEFKLEHRAKVQWQDFWRSIEDLQPEIVHFSGHGVGESGLCVEEDDGTMRLVSADALSRMFKLFSCVKCVVLSACYSEVQANEIRRYVPYVVGMSLSIHDRSARGFAGAFYDGLGAGWDYQKAFDLGLAGMANDAEVLTPVLNTPKVREEVKVEQPTLEVRLTRTQKSNQLEIARLEKDLAAVENELGMPLEAVREGRLQEQKRQLIQKIEILEETLP